MCLSAVTKQYKKPSTAVRRAWGYFAISKKGVVRTGVMYRRVRPDVWMKAAVRTTMRNEYARGFHKLVTKKDAESIREWFPKEVLLPVLLRGVHTEGTETQWNGEPRRWAVHRLRVLVAHEMYVDSKDVEKALQRKKK